MNFKELVLEPLKSATPSNRLVLVCNEQLLNALHSATTEELNKFEALFMQSWAITFKYDNNCNEFYNHYKLHTSDFHLILYKCIRSLIDKNSDFKIEHLMDQQFPILPCIFWYNSSTPINTDDFNLSHFKLTIQQYHFLAEIDIDMALSCGVQFILENPDCITDMPDEVNKQIHDYLNNSCFYKDTDPELLKIFPMLAIEDHQQKIIQFLSRNIVKKLLFKLTLPERVTVILQRLELIPNGFNSICSPFIDDDVQHYGKITLLNFELIETSDSMSEAKFDELKQIANNFYALMVDNQTSFYPLTSCLEKIKNYNYDTEYDHTKIMLLLGWTYYTALKIAELQITQPNAQFDAKVFNEIFNYADPTLRVELSKEYIDIIARKQKLVANNNRTLLPSVLIASLITDDSFQQKDILKHVSSAYKDNANMKYLVRGVLAIKKSPSLSPSAKLILIKKILHMDNIALQKNGWIMLSALAASDLLSKLVEYTMDDEKQINIHNTYLDIVKDLFDLTNEQLCHFKTNFCEHPDHMSILLYYSGLNKLQVEEKDLYVGLLMQFIKLVCSPAAKDFYNFRYDEKFNLHLATIFSNFPQLREVWINGDKQQLPDLIQKYDLKASNKINIVDIIKESIRQGHIQKQSKEIQAAINDLPKLNDKPLAQQINAVQNLITLATTTDVNFIRDCLALKDALRASRFLQNVDHSGYSIVDTDNYWLQLMTGTYVPDSCQSIIGEPSLNKCLIGGYVLSGHVRQLAIFNKEQKLIARAILRLTWDDIAKKPVLILESVYPHTANQLYKKAITEFAKDRAFRMGCDLLVANRDQPSATEKYSNPVSVSFGYGCEYVDAKYGELEYPYSISDLTILAKRAVPALPIAEKTSASMLTAFKNHIYQNKELAVVIVAGALAARYYLRPKT